METFLKSFKEKITNITGELSQTDAVSCLFSGGKDSTLVALAMATLFKDQRIVLITMNNGMLYPNEVIDATQKRKQLIQNMTGHHHIEHIYIDIKKIFCKIGIEPFPRIKDNYKYVYLCLDCKFSMHLAASLWAQKNNVKVILDGYSKRQLNCPEQTEPFMNNVLSRVSQYTNVYNISPIFDLINTDLALFKYIFKFGLDPYKDFGVSKEDQFGWKGQAKCTMAMVNLPIQEDIFSDNVEQKEERVNKYMEELDRYTHEKMALYFSEEILKEFNNVVNEASFLV